MSCKGEKGSSQFSNAQDDVFKLPGCPTSCPKPKQITFTIRKDKKVANPNILERGDVRLFCLL